MVGKVVCVMSLTPQLINTSTRKSHKGNEQSRFFAHMKIFPIHKANEGAWAEFKMSLYNMRVADIYVLLPHEWKTIALRDTSSSTLDYLTPCYLVSLSSENQQIIQFLYNLIGALHLILYLI
jgi:hypothetical protein